MPRALVLLLAAGCLLGPAASADAAKPRIKGMALDLKGHGKPGPKRRVTVRVRLRLCARKGRVRLPVREALLLSGKPFATGKRTTRFRHRGGCDRRVLRWTLRKRFFGVGRYRVRVVAVDKRGRRSKPRTRSHVTLN